MFTLLKSSHRTVFHTIDFIDHRPHWVCTKRTSVSMAAESGEKLVILQVHCVSKICLGATKVWHT